MIFDLNGALEQIKRGAKIDAKVGVLDPLIKQFTEATLWSSVVWALPFVFYVKVFFGFLVTPRADGVQG